ncbi:LacI family DNA-binding transcriptional regulator [Sanguibacter sp. 25GB23B1]|uniref:LacI family DNA-binding transcriptional regulator n=1 Tax=unclassified Sanguibacter TaxID=2645534 RepID=UPI0032AEE0AE
MIGDDGRRPTIRDVAREAGVSAQTVSRVINGSSEVRPTTRAAVERCVAELGFQPDEAARALARLKHGSRPTGSSVAS